MRPLYHWRYITSTISNVHPAVAGSRAIAHIAIRQDARRADKIELAALRCSYTGGIVTVDASAVEMKLEDGRTVSFGELCANFTYSASSASLNTRRTSSRRRRFSPRSE
jgi:hypothetical protein